jgi:hypothetical protein
LCNFGRFVVENFTLANEVCNEMSPMNSSTTLHDFHVFIRLVRITLVVMLFIPIAVLAQDARKDVYRESAWAQRDTWQRPDNIIRQLDLQQGDKVADVGCHEGYFTVKLADAVGDAGKAGKTRRETGPEKCQRDYRRRK